MSPILFAKGVGLTSLHPAGPAYPKSDWQSHATGAQSFLEGAYAIVVEEFWFRHLRHFDTPRTIAMVAHEDRLNFGRLDHPDKSPNGHTFEPAVTTLRLHAPNTARLGHFYLLDDTPHARRQRLLRAHMPRVTPEVRCESAASLDVLLPYLQVAAENFADMFLYRMEHRRQVGGGLSNMLLQGSLIDSNTASVMPHDKPLVLGIEALHHVRWLTDCFAADSAELASAIQRHFHAAWISALESVFLRLLGIPHTMWHFAREHFGFCSFARDLVDRATVDTEQTDLIAPKPFHEQRTWVPRGALMHHNIHLAIWECVSSYWRGHAGRCSSAPVAFEPAVREVLFAFLGSVVEELLSHNWERDDIRQFMLTSGSHQVQANPTMYQPELFKQIGVISHDWISSGGRAQCQTSLDSLCARATRNPFYCLASAAQISRTRGELFVLSHADDHHDFRGVLSRDGSLVISVRTHKNLRCILKQLTQVGLRASWSIASDRVTLPACAHGGERYELWHGRELLAVHWIPVSSRRQRQQVYELIADGGARQDAETERCAWDAVLGVGSCKPRTADAASMFGIQP